MSRQLVDVNVLLALLWSRHESHNAAHAWFAKSGHQAWATNPLVQLGVVRLLTNPNVTQGAVSAQGALSILRDATSHPGHEFWPLDEPLPLALQDLAIRIKGHRQYTDAVLLWQVKHRNGILVTFDAGVKSLAVAEFTSNVLLLKSR